MKYNIFIVFYGFGGFALSILFYILVYFTILQKNYKPIIITETTFFIIHAFSHLLTILLNPGIPGRQFYNKKSININGNMELIECKKCNIIVHKSLDVYHCNICGVCVLNYDHHSFWMGKCIGRNNWFLFYVSTFFISIYLVMSFLSLMAFIIFVHEENIKIQKMSKS